ncbi:hypothetical protein PBR_1404 [Segatella baroniae B14]|uniref:Uncharacterized protein n=1 Tax=Segatella baroniae B14 TaxID=752555 RepID=D8DVX0_9BACT|nr:hypothetical protein PBR_1404 [Segatella baroniae B14]
MVYILFSFSAFIRGLRKLFLLHPPRRFAAAMYIYNYGLM